VSHLAHEATIPAPGRPPRWFLCLPLLAILLWWPISPYWQSDDYLALHYARNFGNVLADFTGPQYGATDIWLFYRPLITLSFWFDQLLGGAEPFVSHLSNVLAHGVSALLAALLWRRFLPDGQAFLAGLLWAMMPGHAGTIAWAVGRVDAHTTVWCLFALLLFVRHCERRRTGVRTSVVPALLATAAALASKELGFVVPPLAVGLGMLMASAGSLRARLHFALRATAPLWVLFAAYLGFRLVVLGRFGGYLGTVYAPLEMGKGLLAIVGNLLVPLRWSGTDVAAGWLGGSRELWIWLAAVPPLLAGLVWLCRPKQLLAAALLFCIASLPMAMFFADAQNVQGLRSFYLPSIVLAGCVAAGGRIVGCLWLLAMAMPFVAIRSTQLDADRQSAALHHALLREAADGAPSPMFVAGLPHANATGSIVQLHFGVDRLLEPPFGQGGTQLYALRPLAEVPGVVRLFASGELPFPLPNGSTWFFADATALGRAPPPRNELPDLRIEGDIDHNGVLDISSARLLDVTNRYAELFEKGAPTFGLRTPGVKPMGFRVTIFTANGYLSCLCLDYGLGGAHDGSIDMLRFLARDEKSVDPAITATQGAAWAGEGLTIPTTIDLVPEFPVLIEAGTLRMPDKTFVPSHRARRLLTFRFDRGYPAWVRLVQGKG